MRLGLGLGYDVRVWGYGVGFGLAGGVRVWDEGLGLGCGIVGCGLWGVRVRVGVLGLGLECWG